MKFLSTRPALIIVDVQKAIDHPSWGRRNNPGAESNIARLLSSWRSRNFPVFHVRHSSTEQNSTYRPNQLGYEFKPEVEPLQDEEIITKNVNCAFIGTDLESKLRKSNIQELVICGVITNNSVDITVRVAGNLGFSVFVPSDATATFQLTDWNGKKHSAEEIHAIFLANLNNEYAKVVRTSEIIDARIIT